MPLTIYTLTPNPALDLSGHVNAIIPNEKNYVHHPRLDPGGNGINAARIARRLGSRPVLLGFLGGATGVQLRQLLKKEGLRQRFTDIRATTRTNVTVSNDQTHQQTRLTFPGPEIRASEVRQLIHEIAGLRGPGILVLGGSAPGGCTADFYTSMIRVAQKADLSLIVDVPVNEMKKILSNSKNKLLLIKPNQVEFEELVQEENLNEAGMVRLARPLLDRVEVVCVSLAERGALVVLREGAWLIRPPRVHTRGTVGAGDSMVGAMTSRLARSRWRDVENVLDAARWGVAAGAATATTEGTSLGSAKLIRELYAKARTARLI